MVFQVQSYFKFVLITTRAVFKVNFQLGMLLTIADAGAPSIALSGPKNLLQFLGSTRYFCHRYFICSKT